MQKNYEKTFRKIVVLSNSFKTKYLRRINIEEIPVLSANFKPSYLDHRHRGVQLLEKKKFISFGDDKNFEKNNDTFSDYFDY